MKFCGAFVSVRHCSDCEFGSPGDKSSEELSLSGCGDLKGCLTDSVTLSWRAIRAW